MLLPTFPLSSSMRYYNRFKQSVNNFTFDIFGWLTSQSAFTILPSSAVTYVLSISIIFNFFHFHYFATLLVSFFFFQTRRYNQNMSKFYVYWIRSAQRCYIGATTCPTKRLRQHNGEIQGGALRTRNGGPWRFHCVIAGFRTWVEALQFEWAFKYYSRRCRGVESRKVALVNLMARERWTSNAPLASEVPLQVEYSPTQYGEPNLDKFRAAATTTRKRKKNTEKRTQKLKLGVSY